MYGGIEANPLCRNDVKETGYLLVNIEKRAQQLRKELDDLPYKL